MKRSAVILSFVAVLALVGSLANTATAQTVDLRLSQGANSPDERVELTQTNKVIRIKFASLSSQDQKAVKSEYHKIRLDAAGTNDLLTDEEFIHFRNMISSNP